MRLTRKATAWAGGVAAVAVALTVAAIYRHDSGRGSSSQTRAGKVSQMLLDLTSGPKGLEALRVPEGFEVSLAAGPDLVTYPMFATFDDRGRLFLCESSGINTSSDQELADALSFRIRMIEDSDGDGVFDRSTVFAKSITMAMGAQWHRGSLYVAAPPDLARYTDTDNDGVADRREVILTGWPLKANATTLHGPYLGPDGWMYLTYSPAAYKVRTKEGTVLEGPGGRVFRFQPDGTRLEWFVGGGFDNPVEITFTPAGETIGTMTYYSQPMNGVRDALLHYVDGAVYPKWTPISDKKIYKRTGDLMPAVTKFARVAPAGVHYYRSDHLGAEYKGNLFSAHFNPHRVLRHVLHREEGTFRTDDTDFLTSSDIDFHPTDVLEDADGSLLVVDTGGWFLRGCPVSRISKPQFEGAVYRVRRNNAPRVDDPRGLRLGLAKAPASELARLLEDPRPAVRDQALDYLVQAGAASIAPLAGVLERSNSEARAAAVFALGRIPDPKSADAVRAALRDPDFQVRVAAARMAGLNADKAAVGRLADMVKRDHAAVRRQAAEALGRIGDASAVPALIAASADPDGRFVEHAIIYALIRLRDPGPLVVALQNASPQVRKAALIALDQMDGGPLRREQLVAQLGATDEQLGNAVLWVAGHHPEWSSDIRSFLRARLENRRIGDVEAESLRRSVLSFCSDEGTQQMLADLLAGSSKDPERQIFLLDTMDRCSLEKMPASWTVQIRQLLDRPEDKAQARAITLAGSRKVLEARPQLERIAGDEARPPAVRVAALSALASQSPALGEAGFRFLFDTLRSGQDAELRLSAAQALSRTSLSKPQLLALARDYTGQADPLVLPVLFNAFDRSRDEEVARTLIDALLRSRTPLSGMAGERLEELLKGYSRSVQAAATPLMNQIREEKNSRAARLKQLEPLLTAGGDTGRGRQLFFGKKVACASCHTIGAEGGHVGPDLTSVGAVRSGLDILEAIIFPSASFVPGHEVYRVTTANAVHTGVRQGSGAGGVVVLVCGPGDVVRIPRKEVVSIEPSSVSLMPDGFDTTLTNNELADLLAFLQSQTSRDAATLD